MVNITLKQILPCDTEQFTLYLIKTKQGWFIAEIRKSGDNYSFYFDDCDYILNDLEGIFILPDNINPILKS